MPRGDLQHRFVGAVVDRQARVDLRDRHIAHDAGAGDVEDRIVFLLLLFGRQEPCHAAPHERFVVFARAGELGFAVLLGCVGHLFHVAGDRAARHMAVPCVGHGWVQDQAHAHHKHDAHRHQDRDELPVAASCQGGLGLGRHRFRRHIALRRVGELRQLVKSHVLRGVCGRVVRLFVHLACVTPAACLPGVRSRTPHGTLLPCEHNRFARRAPWGVPNLHDFSLRITHGGRTGTPPHGRRACMRVSRSRGAPTARRAPAMRAARRIRGARIRRRSPARCGGFRLR